VVVRESQYINGKPAELTAAMRSFFERLKPQIDQAAATKVRLAIENHGDALLSTPDSFKAFVDLNPAPQHVGLAVAPFHLQNIRVSVEEVIRTAGSQLLFFYAWQSAAGINQLPGHGPADFAPWLKALADVNYQGYVNPFMHGHPSPDELSAGLAKANSYLKACHRPYVLPQDAETFALGGHNAFVHAAPTPAPGKPWVWYAPTLGSLAPGERKGYFEAFVKAGIGVAGFDLGEVRGSPASTARFALFYEEMVKRGYSRKPILLGQSRGGMMTLAWAFRNPDKVKAWVGIYPVCNLASWPLQSSKAQTLADFAMTEPELVAALPRFNPIDNLQGLLANKVPMFAVHGDHDVLVPYDLNTLLLKQRYEAGGGSIQVKVIPGKGHQVDPAFFDCQELVDFVLKQAE
jgi:pimeloyl-ACP methyl ester carboxylesterase